MLVISQRKEEVSLVDNLTISWKGGLEQCGWDIDLVGTFLLDFAFWEVSLGQNIRSATWTQS